MFYEIIKCLKKLPFAITVYNKCTLICQFLYYTLYEGIDNILGEVGSTVKSYYVFI